MAKDRHPFVPCSIWIGRISTGSGIDASASPPGTLQDIHDDVMGGLNIAMLLGDFAKRDEVPAESLLRTAILEARRLHKKLDGDWDRLWTKFSGVHSPVFGVPFHGQCWPSYHRAAAELCCFWLSAYEQGAQGSYGMLERMPLEEVVVKAIEKWPMYVERAKQLKRPPPLVRIDWPMNELRTACEVEFDKAAPLSAAGGGGGGGGQATSETIAVPVKVPVLSEKQYLILETMNVLDALSADTRRSAEDIAVACDGNRADVNAFKPLLSDLTKNHKLTESKTGRGGGSWLTDRGVDVANRLVENRKASVPKR